MLSFQNVLNEYSILRFHWIIICNVWPNDISIIESTSNKSLDLSLDLAAIFAGVLLFV